MTSAYRGGFSADGGAIIVTAPTPAGSTMSNATLTVHVSSDSTAGLITGYSTNASLSYDYNGTVSHT